MSKYTSGVSAGISICAATFIVPNVSSAQWFVDANAYFCEANNWLYYCGTSSGWNDDEDAYPYVGVSSRITSPVLIDQGSSGIPGYDVEWTGQTTYPIDQMDMGVCYATNDPISHEIYVDVQGQQYGAAWQTFESDYDGTDLYCSSN